LTDEVNVPWGARICPVFRIRGLVFRKGDATGASGVKDWTEEIAGGVGEREAARASVCSAELDLRPAVDKSP
jgi:hypothetical protein